MKSVRQMIVMLEMTAAELSEMAAVMRQCAVSLRDIFQIEPVQAAPPAPPPAERTNRRKTKPPKGQSAGRAGRKNASTFSKYKGVYRGYRRKDGSYRYAAAITRQGKKQDLGQFNIEEQAAAVAATARGETALAGELFQIADKKAGKRIDRAASLRKLVPQSTPAPPRYQCSHCGFKSESPVRPDRCANCDSASFKPV